jgi:RHS repeat-associated protein
MPTQQNKPTLFATSRIVLALCVLACMGVATPALGDGPPPENFCYEGQFGTQSSCHTTLEDAEAAMRDALPAGPYLEFDRQVAITGTPGWEYRYYKVSPRPAVEGTPGYTAKGWNAEALGCNGIAFAHWLTGQSYCSSESEIREGHIAQRLASIPPESGCSSTFGDLTGSYGPFQENLSGPEQGGRMSNKDGRYFTEEHTCPQTGTDLRDISISMFVPLACPLGFNLTIMNSPASPVRPAVCSSNIAPRIRIKITAGESCKSNKNPCYPGTGEKRRHEPDFEFAGESFSRTYRSLGQFSQGKLGEFWSHSLGAHISSRLPGYALIDSDGSYLPLVSVGYAGGAQLYRARGLSDRLIRKTASEYELVGVDGHTQFFDAVSGRLLRRVHSSDPSRNLQLAYNSEGTLLEATDGLNRKITFHYKIVDVPAYAGIQEARPEQRLERIVLPDGGFVEYTYNARGYLIEVRRADDSVRTYHYDEPAHAPLSPRGLMTGISDQGIRYATFTYDAYGRVTSSALAQNAERTELSYVSANEVDVTTPNGLTRRYTFDTSLERRITSIADSRGIVSNSYNADRYRTESIDFLGRRTTYTHLNGRVATITEAAGTADARSVTFARDDRGRVLSKTVTSLGIWSPGRKSFYARNAQGRITAACSGPANTSYVCGSSTDAIPSVRQTTYGYCDATDASQPGSVCPIIGLPKFINGPRPGIEDTTLFTYYSSDDLSGCTSAGPCQRTGDLHTVIAPGGLTTTFVRYDLAGRPTQVLDANSVVSDYEYNERGWVTARKVRGPDSGSETDDAITRVEFNADGLVTRFIQPDGAFLSFSYDAAHRLVAIEDDGKNSVSYTLDGAGNRVAEDVRDTAGLLRRKLMRVYNQLGQLETIADAEAIPTDLTYDPTGNLASITDPLNRRTEREYDPLGRIVRSISNASGGGVELADTSFEYDPLDNLTAVIDPNGLITSYEYDGLGNLVRFTSPDTGTTTYAYDIAGNRVRQLDARGIESHYSYDALNRLTGITLPTPSQNVAFAYDTAPPVCPPGETFAIGRLRQFTDASGSTQYCYDNRGNVVRKVQTVTTGPTRTVRYTHSAADRVMAITYPSGLVLKYTRNAAGQITGVTAKNSPSEAPVALVTNAGYLPFGPLTSLTFGNGRVLEKAYDLNYGIAAITDNASDGLALAYTLNDVGNVTGLTELQSSGATATRTIDYDGLHRLTALKAGTTLMQGFGYDATGNRTSKKSPGNSAYQYAPDSHRLTKVGSQTRAHDAAGSTTRIHNRNYVYDDRGRLVRSLNGTTVLRDYRHNALGQRVAKLHPTPASSIFFVYDEAGRLLGEYKPNGALIKEYIWLEDTLIAVRGGYAGHKFQYVLTDHLNTPRAIVLPATNAIIWRWDLAQTAFGDHTAQNNPDGDTYNYVFNMRYPGQYFDGETGLHYNYFRDYEPGTGRYLQSDPIGLGGGLSTFGYTSSNPFNRIDPLGLFELLGPDCYSRYFGSVKIPTSGEYAITESRETVFRGPFFMPGIQVSGYEELLDARLRNTRPSPLGIGLTGEVIMVEMVRDRISWWENLETHHFDVTECVDPCGEVISSTISAGLVIKSRQQTRPATFSRPYLLPPRDISKLYGSNSYDLR